MQHYTLTKNVDPTIFRAYDIRGIVDETLTPDAVYTIARAFASEAIAKNIRHLIIARDGRLSGEYLSQALAQGLVDGGCDVTNIGAVPTPVLYFATHELKTGSGIMLTGSHNPANYNGLKMMLGGETLSEDTIQQLLHRIQRNDFSEGYGALKNIDITQDYIKRISTDARVKKPLKIVVDAGNGITGNIAPMLYRALGCEVIELFCEVDGNFPNHHPDPSKPKNLKDIIAAVKKENADIGFAFDGDGDRLGVITNYGDIIAPDRQLMLYAIDVLSRHPDAQIIFDVKCSRLLGKVIREHGGKPLMWKTGHSLIKQKMKELNVPLAGEMSGHIFFKERWYGFDDALYTGARLLEILSNQQEDAHDLFGKLPAAISTPEINVDMADDKKFQFVEALVKQAHFQDAEIFTLDGLRVEFSDGWGLVRCSNTTPCLVLRFEADNENALDRIKNEIKQAMLNIDAGLILDF